MLLSFDDIVSSSLVCQRLSEIIQNSSPLWKQLLWSMYPGTSLVQYGKTRSASCDGFEYNKNIHLAGANNHVESPSNDPGSLHTQMERLRNKYNSKHEELEPSNVAKKLCLQIKNAKNYWKCQFGSRHAIGLLAKEWMGR